MVLGENFIFIHVPKTGGTSITAALGGRTPGTVYRLHLPIFAVSEAHRAERKSFGIVRNPWAWVLSNYCYNNRPHRKDHFRRWLFDKEFRLKDDLRRPNPQPIQRRSQMYWLEGCDRIGRHENLAAEFEDICQEFGIEAAPLPHRNRSAGSKSPSGSANYGLTQSLKNDSHSEFERRLTHQNIASVAVNFRRQCGSVLTPKSTVGKYLRLRGYQRILLKLWHLRNAGERYRKD